MTRTLFGADLFDEPIVSIGGRDTDKRVLIKICNEEAPAGLGYASFAEVSSHSQKGCLDHY